jgi:hypothetical protein
MSGFPAKLDLNNHKVSILDFDSSYTNLKVDSVDYMSAYKNKIYALLMAGDKLLIYDTVSHQCNTVDIDCSEYEWGNFIGMYIYESKVFIFPCHKKEIIVVDCNNLKKNIISYQNLTDQNFFTSCIVGNRIWMFPQNGTVIGCFNLQGFKVEEYITDIDMCDVRHCSILKNDIYILGRENIYCWNVEDNKMSILLTDEYMKEMGRIAATQKKLILLPSLGNDIKIFDLDNKRMSVLEEYPEDFTYDDSCPGWSKYYGCCDDDGKIYYAMRRSDYMLVVDKITGHIDWFQPRFPTNDDKFHYLFTYNKNILYENECSVRNFVKYLPFKTHWIKGNF